MPNEILETSNDYQAGAVNVLYGAWTGITDVGDQLWTQDVPGVKGIAESDDYFGSALAAGDFGGDGDDDLAIGVPSEDLSGRNTFGAGAVNVLYGTHTITFPTDELQN